MKNYKIDDDTRFRFELQEKINYYNVRAMTKKEFNEMMKDYGNDYYMTEGCEEVYTSKIETREVDYQAVEEDETLPFDF